MYISPAVIVRVMYRMIRKLGFVIIAHPFIKSYFLTCLISLTPFITGVFAPLECMFDTICQYFTRICPVYTVYTIYHCWVKHIKREYPPSPRLYPPPPPTPTHSQIYKSYCCSRYKNSLPLATIYICSIYIYLIYI